MKMYDIASRMAGYLACETGLEQSKVDVVRYGLEIILGEIIKWAILLTSAALLGVLPGAVSAMLSMAVYRLVSGGAHCQDYWRCLTFGMIVFIGVGKLGVLIAPHMAFLTLAATVAASVLLMALINQIWAPGEVVHRKISPKERPLFKKLSQVCLVVWALVAVFIIAPYSMAAALSGLLSMMVQSLSFTPVGYKAIDSFDIMLSKIIGERRCFENAEKV